jgi:hypothetical protein
MEPGMSAAHPDDPRLTYALYKLQDVLDAQREHPHPDFLDITTHHDEVLARYQPVFHPSHIPNLTRYEFESFLYFKNNHHWDSLHRVKTPMTANMPLLRQALSILLDEGRPVRERLNQIRPERYFGQHSMVSHLGTPVLTAILLVVNPDKYGVWNNTSDEGLHIVRMWDPRWGGDPAGDVYDEMNRIYQQLCHYLQIDLWTLDALWWILKR